MTGNTKVVQLLDGLMALKGDTGTVDVGVVVGILGLKRADVGGQQCRTRNSSTVGTNSGQTKQALNKHGHLFTRDIVVRRIGRSRRTIGDTQLLELVDRRLDLSRLTADIGEALISTRTQSVTGLSGHTGQVQSHLPTGNAR